KRGHYPKGGGKAVLETRPVRRLQPVEAVDFGKLVKIEGISHAVNLPPHVAERQAKAARETLGQADIKIEVRNDGLGPGSGVVLWATSDMGNVVGGDALGERGKPAEAVGREAAEKLLAALKSGATLDSHMADMAVVYMALADGVSKMSTPEATTHLQTNIYVIERFLPAKTRLHKSGGRWIVETQGYVP
ncbi:MAG: RNA 3'-terminal phosphate cyclase, partial [Pyrobaculum sp.]